MLPSFKTPDLLMMALTHPSYRKQRINNFERLEFLGDRVLGLIIAEMLYDLFPKEKEGDLAKRSAALVNRDICFDVATEINLMKHIKVIGADLTQNTSVLSDAMEALIGAFYLDSGWEAVRQFVIPLWKKRIESTQKPLNDYKSQLQEWSQKHSLGIPEYITVSTTGPAHGPEFVVEVRAGIHKMTATGTPRKQAEQEAARLLLESLNIPTSSEPLKKSTHSKKRRTKKAP